MLPKWNRSLSECDTVEASVRREGATRGQGLRDVDFTGSKTVSSQICPPLGSLSRINPFSS
jgi:hypothetical protein